MNRPGPDGSRGSSPRGQIAIVVLAAAYVQAAIGGPVQFTPSVDEAVERGVVYEMTAYPQQFGYIGFGTGFADLDDDGSVGITDFLTLLGNWG